MCVQVVMARCRRRDSLKHVHGYVRRKRKCCGGPEAETLDAVCVGSDMRGAPSVPMLVVLRRRRVGCMMTQDHNTANGMQSGSGGSASGRTADTNQPKEDKWRHGEACSKV